MKIKNLKLSPFSIYRIHIRIINTSTLSLVSRHDAIDNRPHPSSVAVVRALKIRGRSKSTRRAIPRFPRFSELCRDTLDGFPHHSMRTASIRCSRRNFNALTDENIVTIFLDYPILGTIFLILLRVITFLPRSFSISALHEKITRHDAPRYAGAG